jgi:hypothetical protein
MLSIRCASFISIIPKELKSLSVNGDMSVFFHPGTLVSSTNKTDRHDITEILLKVVLSTNKPSNQPKELFTASIYLDMIT